MIFYIGLIFSVIGMLYVIKKTFDARNVLSPQMFVFAGILLYLYLPALVNKYTYVTDDSFNIAILLGTIGCWTSAFVFPYKVVDQVKPAKYEPKEHIFKKLTYVYVILLFYEIFDKIRQAGSILAVFMSNRLEAYLGENLTEGSSPIHMLIFEGLKIISFFYIDILYSKGNKKQAVLVFLAPMAHHMFTANTRFDFVAMAGAMLLYIVNKKLYKDGKDENSKYNINNKKKLNFIKISIIAFLGSYSALIFMRFANLVRHGLVTETLDLSYASLLLDTFGTDSNYYEFLHDLYLKISSGEIGLEYGLAWFLAPIINFIPRTIWPGKPYTSFSVRGTEYVYWDYTSGNPVCTFTIFGEGYGQFGSIGCLIAPIFFLAVRWITFRQANEIKYNQLFQFLVMFSLLTYMRAEAPVFLMMLDTFWFYVIKQKLVTKSCNYQEKH